MKRMLLLCIALLLAMRTAACAEALSEEISYKDAINVLQEMNASIMAISETELDSDSQEIIQFCQYQLALAEAGLMMTVPENILLQDEDLFAQEESSTAEETPEERYSVPPTYVDDLGYGQGYVLYKKGNYMLMESSIYDAELALQLEFVRIEIAVRPDTNETMILLTQLQNKELLTNSSRYLVYSDAVTVKSMFRRTLGSDTEYRIDLSAWVSGKDYEWKEKLLYPRVSE